MLIFGIQKFTVLDYPEHTACVVFTPGCQFRCGYCHNPEFVLPELIARIKHNFIPEDVFFNFLKQRVKKLDGVVISGGEPTMMPDLADFMRRVKELGFLVKLDTNGNNPVMLQNIIDARLADYIAMDVKTSLAAYQTLVGDRAKAEAIRTSIEFIRASGIRYEFRSTLIKEIHTSEILRSMAESMRGADMLYLQQFRPGHTLDPQFGKYHAFSKEEMEEIADVFREQVKHVSVRV